jgi:hypothetical protein
MSLKVLIHEVLSGAGDLATKTTQLLDAAGDAAAEAVLANGGSTEEAAAAKKKVTDEAL